MFGLKKSWRYVEVSSKTFFTKFLIARKIFSTCPQIGKIFSFLWTKGGYVQVYPFDSNEKFHKVCLTIFISSKVKSGIFPFLGSSKDGGSSK